MGRYQGKKLSAIVAFCNICNFLLDGIGFICFQGNRSFYILALFFDVEPVVYEKLLAIIFLRRDKKYRIFVK